MKTTQQLNTLLLAMLCVISVSIGSLTAQVKNPGKLYSLTTSEGNLKKDLFTLVGGEENLTSITNLRITGAINENDVADLKLLLMYGPNLGQKALLLRLDLSNCSLPNNTLETTAFGQTAVKELILSQSLEVIEANALLDSRVEFLTIGKNTKTICGKRYTPGTTYKDVWNGLTRLPILKQIKIDPENKVYKVVDNVLYTKDGKLLILYPNQRAGERFVTPNETIEIGTAAFMGNSFLTEIDLNKVEVISNSAFSNCEKLRKISWGTKLKTIGDYAFNRIITEKLVLNDKDLMKILLPEGLEYIGKSAFEPTLGIQSIVLPSTVTFLGEKCFAGDGIYYSHLQTLDMSKATSLQAIPTYMCYYANQLENVIFPSEGNLSEIGEGAFLSCSGLKKIDIPNSVKVIARQAFMMYDEINPTQLNEVTIGNGVEEIHENAFAKLKALQSFSIATTTPPILQDAVFAQTPCNEATLFVPSEAIDNYKNKEPWNKFKQVQPLSKNEPNTNSNRPWVITNNNSIEVVPPSAGVLSIYSINGKHLYHTKINTPREQVTISIPRGTYIVNITPTTNEATITTKVTI